VIEHPFTSEKRE